MGRHVNTAQVERELVRLMRETVLAGSRRDVEVTVPLGPDGLGLDSLGIVEFVVAAEKRFRSRIPDAIWQRSASVTLSELATLISAQGPDGAQPTP